MPSEHDVAWAAGLFEGEGCISVRGARAQHVTYTEARLFVQLTDEDVLLRFARIVGGRVSGPLMKAGGRKPVWTWGTSRRSEVHRIIRLLRPYLGERRGAKADFVLSMPQGDHDRSWQRGSGGRFTSVRRAA